MRGRLSSHAVATLPSSVAVPAYDRAKVAPGIVHLGVGAFHRAHQAAYVDDCLAGGETGWGIVGASLQSASTQRRARSAGRSLYAGRARQRRRKAARHRLDPVGAGRAAEIPARCSTRSPIRASRIVTLTITEKAYLRNAAGRPRRDASGHRRRPCHIPAGRRPRSAFWSRRWRAAALRERRPSRSSPATTFPPMARRCTACSSSSPELARSRRLPAMSQRTSPARRAWSTASCRRRPTPTARASRRRSASRTPGR